MKILVVVDMQNDFVYGALANKDAEAIIPKVKNKIIEARKNNDIVMFTKDTHLSDYLSTEEGKNLPVEHCIHQTHGWELIDELKEFENPCRANIYEKNTFGSVDIGKHIASIIINKKYYDNINITQIDIIGICTDICVINNAAVIKAFAPNVPIHVDASCCAGVTPERHKIALEAMKAFQIHIDNEEES